MNKKTQLNSYFSNFFVLLLSLLTVGSCHWNQKDSAKRDFCLQRTDTLWSIVNETKGKFSFNYEEIIDRKETMDSFSQMMKFIPIERVNAEMKGTLNQYAAILRLYKPLAGEYKNSVLRTEDMFYQIKSLEKLVKNGEYDNKMDIFKIEYEKMKKEFLNIHSEAIEITEKLNTVEPLYIRISEQAELFIEANLPGTEEWKK